MKKLIPLLFYMCFLSKNADSQIIDYKDDKGNTGFNLNRSVNIPYVKDKISIFIFEKRGINFDPNSISISEQLNSCNINFDKFVIYRFNLVSGICSKFDSVQYRLNGSVWYKKPVSMDIKKHYICISVPDTSTYNLILSKFGKDAVNSMYASPRKINHPNPIAFLSFSDANKENLETKLLELISKNDLEEANNKIAALNDSLLIINEKLASMKPNYDITLLGSLNCIGPQGIRFSNSSSQSIGFGIAKFQTFNKRKISSSVLLKSSALNLRLDNPTSERFIGTRQDQFNDLYYSYYHTSKFVESIQFSFLSAGLNAEYYTGKKQQSYIHFSVFYNFGGATSQKIESFSLTHYGKYPSLNFDTLVFSSQMISHGSFQFRESFMTGIIGVGKQIDLVRNKIIIGGSVDYYLSQNLIQSNTSKDVYLETNNQVSFNSSLGNITSFNLNGFSFQLNLKYAL
jgi:hypothetical protein